MKHIFIILLLIAAISQVSYAYELRLHFSRSYVYNDMLYIDVRTYYENEIYQNIKYSKSYQKRMNFPPFPI